MIFLTLEMICVTLKKKKAAFHIIFLRAKNISASKRAVLLHCEAGFP
jgi:hypothetical protein